MRLSAWVRLTGEVAFTIGITSLCAMHFMLIYFVIAAIVGVGAFVFFTMTLPELGILPNLNSGFGLFFQIASFCGDVVVSILLGLMWPALPTIIAVERISERIVNGRKKRGGAGLA